MGMENGTLHFGVTWGAIGCCGGGSFVGGIIHVFRCSWDSIACATEGAGCSLLKLNLGARVGGWEVIRVLVAVAREPGRGPIPSIKGLASTTGTHVRVIKNLSPRLTVGLA